MKQTKFFTIIEEPKYVKCVCPYCGLENEYNVDVFFLDDLLEEDAVTECLYCDKEFELKGLDWA